MDQQSNKIIEGFLMKRKTSWHDEEETAYIDRKERLNAYARKTRLSTLRRKGRA